MAFYEGIDEEIYEGGDHYVPMQQFRLNKFNNTVAPAPPEITEQATQEFGIPYTNAFTGGGDNLGGWGLFGNLDKSTQKTFSKQVWEDADANVPGSGGWVTKNVKGWLDPKSGNYKTYEGKNIDHAGLFTGAPEEGDIEGTGFQFPSIVGGIVQWLKNKTQGVKDKVTGGKDEVKDQTIVTGTNQEGDQSGMAQGSDTPPNQGTSQGDHWSSAHSDLKQEPSGDYKFADYKHGGIVSMLGREGFKTGGRQDAEGGENQWKAGVGLINEGGDVLSTAGMGGQGDGNNQGNTGGVTQLNTDLISTEPSIEAMYSPLELATLRARLYNKDLLTEDNINLEGELSGSNNLIDYGINFTGEGITGSNVGIGPFEVNMDPHKNIENISLNQDIGNWNVQGNTDLENYGLGVNYNQEGGPFFAGATTDNMGNKNFNVGAKWSWGQPDQPVNTLSYDDLIYGQNLRHGGLVSIL